MDAMYSMCVPLHLTINKSFIALLDRIDCTSIVIKIQLRNEKYEK